MNYKSPLKMFRDMNKNPDMFPPDPKDKRIIKEELEKDYEKTLNNGQETINKDVEVKGRSGKQFIEAVNLIKSLGKSTSLKGNKAELEIIQERQKYALSLLERVLEDVRNYITQVNSLKLNKEQDYNSLEAYQEAISSSDTERRYFHNKLIRDLKMAMRFINVNFNIDTPETFRLKEEAKYPERRELNLSKLKSLLAKHNYVKFPLGSGVFIDFSRIPKNPQGERDYIADWAWHLYSDLSALSKSVSSGDK